MNTINNTPSVQIRRMSVTDQQGKTTEFSRSTKSVNNDSTQHPQVTTDKKTVHLKDITGLKKEINAGIQEIRDSIKGIMSNNTRWNSPEIILNLSTQFCKLQDRISEYQDKLNSSSYSHHKSKQVSINKLNNKIEATAPSIVEAKGKLEYINKKFADANSPQGVKSNLVKLTENNQALKDRINNA